MSRAALMAAITALVLLSVPPAWTLSPHMDSATVPGGCRACHRGHGVSASPMLPDPVDTVCLSCHGDLDGRSRMIRLGLLAGDARPPLLEPVLANPYRHPMDGAGLSSAGLSVPVCTSCHAPHRGSMRDAHPIPGQAKISPRDPGRFEYELCESCHGRAGSLTGSLLDLSRLFYPGNPSFHPVEAPSPENSPSVIPELAGGRISCTDCHGNSDPAGPAGPHGSSVEHLLRFSYQTLDGPESPERYALCYACHERDRLLGTSAFPEHGLHIEKIGAACATCHNPHGSVSNRALIRFGEETSISGVTPSPSTGRLSFVSNGPGSGSCFLSCHGRDHGPARYGSEVFRSRQPGISPRSIPGREERR